MSKEHILVVDDEQDIQELLRYNLTEAGYKVTGVTSGEEALNTIKKQTFELILVDLILPGMDGFEICRRFKQDSRTQHIPLIIVTAKAGEPDIVTGLELGADDYIVKPFSPQVLLARIRSVLRCFTRMMQEDEIPISIHGILINPGRHEVVVGEQVVELTSAEFRLLHLLARRPGWVFTRAQIVRGVFGEDYPFSSRSVDVQIVGLRKKLGPAGKFVETVRSEGYRLKGN